MPSANQPLAPQPFEANRRRCNRIPVEVEVTLLVVFPEETFSPRPMRGVTHDLSLSGMRVVTYQASEPFYRRIIQAIRYARATMRLPGTNEEIMLHGRIVWVHFDNKQDPPCCDFGISFEKLKDSDVAALERSIDMISKTMVNLMEPAVVLRPNPGAPQSNTAAPAPNSAWSAFRPPSYPKPPHSAPPQAGAAQTKSSSAAQDFLQKELDSRTGGSAKDTGDHR